MQSYIYLRSEIFNNSPPNNVVCSYWVELSASAISLMEYIVVCLTVHFLENTGVFGNNHCVWYQSLQYTHMYWPGVTSKMILFRTEGVLLVDTPYIAV